MKRRLTISLDERDYVELERLADQDQRSMSWVICQAVKRYLEEVRAADRPHLLRERQISLL